MSSSSVASWNTSSGLAAPDFGVSHSMASQTLLDQTFENWTPGKDTAVLTLGTQEPNSVVTRCVLNAKGAEWALKMPGNVGSQISQTTLTEIGRAHV